ncbi:Protein of unknown function [Nitrosomonas aestuarii]|uniref:DUF2933 domain-containing protein n=1 Tax=Nitrosomonas aestuarii TaxID=52441 RepID=A0A1I4GYV1_9PROT|nr:DUF2933 domain-containing protein [Nitrosomonas aestuarii]SFL35174.1 Protein of unknown function [Nitrosomonas aestuarii]HNP51238.1 DUF2933 domain-containing protein [Nitrosomonas nitrosa]
MKHNSMKDQRKNFWKNPLVLSCLVVVGYWIYTYHWEHALGFLPYTILLLCPLMHIFMHGNHGHGGNGDYENPKNNQDTLKGKQHAR